MLLDFLFSQRPMRTLFDDVIDFHDQYGCIKFQVWDFKAVLPFIGV